MLENLLKPLWHFEEESVKLSDSTVKKAFQLIQRCQDRRPQAGINRLIEKLINKIIIESIELQEDTLRLIEKVVKYTYKDADGFTQKVIAKMLEDIGLKTEMHKSATAYERSLKRKALSLYPRYTTINNEITDACKHYLRLERFKGLVKASDNILFMGSCFARSMNERYQSAGYNSEHVTIFEWRNTPLEINKRLVDIREKKTYSKAQLEAALKERCWSTLDDINRIQKKDFIPNIFVITYGKSQQLKEHGERMHSLPTEEYDYMKVVKYLAEIVNICKSLNSQSKIIFMLSPVPLTAAQVSNSIGSAVEADVISKSVGRLAIQKLLEKEPKDVIYWPSFEVTRWLLCNLETSLYGENTDLYHLSQKSTELHEKLFMEVVS